MNKTGRSLVFIIAAVVFGAGTMFVMALYANITARKMEGERTSLRIAELTETTIDPAEWGKNFPREYDGYIRTTDNDKARFKWSEGRPPEDDKAASKLAADPRLTTIFNGYAFAIDYRERRGHAFMLLDQRETERVKQKPQPGACLNCHASNVVAYREIGMKNGAPGSLADGLDSENGASNCSPDGNRSTIRHTPKRPLS
jgi:nitrite reductase (cytochrome c-552)